MIPVYFENDGTALGSAETNAYEEALVTSGESWWTADFWYRTREHAASIILFEDGQITLDDTATTSRWATLTVPNPNDRFHADSNVLFLDRLLRLEHHQRVPALDDRVVTCPTFTGPISKCDPDADGVLSIEAFGKELWMRGQIKTQRKFPKGHLVTTAIRQILIDAGEDPFWINVPDLNHKLPSPGFQVGPKTAGGAWGACLYLADTINCDLFYDGASRVQLRKRGRAVVWTWHAAKAGSVIDPPPEVSLHLGGIGGAADDVNAIVNDYIVIGQGKPPKGGGKPPVVRGEAIAPARNRFSPQSLGNPGPPGLYLVERADMPGIRLNATAQEIAETRLRRRLQAAEQAAGNSVVVPHLDILDHCRLHFEPITQDFILTQAAIPLRWSPDYPMTFGYVEQVSEPPQRLRA